MGKGHSSLAFLDHKADMFAMTVHRPDKISFLYCPPKVLDEVFLVMTKRWEFVNEVMEFGEHTLKFHGKVFPQMTNTERQQKTNLMIFDIVKCLYDKGWGLSCRSIMSRNLNISTYFFTLQPQLEKERNMVCVSSRSKGWIYLTKPGAKELQPLVMKAAQYGCRAYDPTEFDDVENNDGVQSFLYKTAWGGEDDSTAGTKKFLVELFYQFERHGYQYYGSGDSEEGIDSIYFVRDSSGGDETPTVQRFWLMGLAKTDRLRISVCSGMSEEDFEKLKNVVRSNIASNWPDGLEKELAAEDYHEFIMNGSPWATGEKESVAARVFLAILYENLLKAGWGLHCTLDFSPKKLEPRLFQMFRSCPSRAIPHMAISLNQSDKLRLMRCPPEIHTGVMRPLIMRYWPGGIQEESEYAGGHEFKLKGNPWKQDSANVRGLMCILQSKLAQCGWTVVASAKLSRRAETPVSNNFPVSFPVFLHTIWLAKTTDKDVQSEPTRPSGGAKISRIISRQEVVTTTVMH